MLKLASTYHCNGKLKYAIHGLFSNVLPDKLAAMAIVDLICLNHQTETGCVSRVRKLQLSEMCLPSRQKYLCDECRFFISYFDYRCENSTQN